MDLLKYSLTGLASILFAFSSFAAESSPSLPALRAAVHDLIRSFPQQYPKGPDYLRRLDQLEKQGPANPRRAEDIAALQREALVANPLISRQPILFVVRQQYKPDHHNTETMFQTNEINTKSFQGGSALKTIDFARGGEVTTLLQLADGVVRDPEVHFDGQKIVLSLRQNIGDDYHIYQINTDGSGLRQLTFAAGVSDIDPLYLPDDTIVFSSTREPKYCMCNRHIMANLYRMEADGANIHQIGKNTLHEGHAALLPDGRILYDRWEYVDRNFGDGQGLWTVHPDGTHHATVYGNNTPAPGGVIDGRAVPGTGQILCIFSSCHDRPWGALALIDPRQGVDGRAPVVRTWPAEASQLVRDPGTANNAWDAFLRVRPKYEDPYPLSAKYFLCSRMTGQGEEMGIYLVDVFGNEVLLHVEGPGCYDPMPLGPRPRPPTLPARRNFDNANGYFYVHDVYQGTYMEKVPRGTVKSLRVIESPERRSWTYPAWMGQGTMAPAMNWHDFNNKRILGTVPVAADGSAYFAVPADRFVYFQLLDGDGLMVQSMRSGAIVQSGERAGCIGCHDNRRATPTKTTTPAALKRPPSQLHGWHGPPRLFSYTAEIQPIFDRHCVRCHDFGQEAGLKLNLAGDRNPVFNTSYSELWRKGFIKAIGAGPAETQPPYAWGSHPSRLVATLKKDHYGVKLDRDSLDKIATWIDINAPYYPSYFSAYPDHPYGRSPLDTQQLARLQQLGVWTKDVTQIVFERPELSPGLAKFTDKNDPHYQEALAIIRTGKDLLAKRPRADMPGFQPAAIDQQRDARYLRRRQIEQGNRAAIRAGQKLYDGPE